MHSTLFIFPYWKSIMVEIIAITSAFNRIAFSATSIPADLQINADASAALAPLMGQIFAFILEFPDDAVFCMFRCGWRKILFKFLNPIHSETDS